MLKWGQLVGVCESSVYRGWRGSIVGPCLARKRARQFQVANEAHMPFADVRRRHVRLFWVTVTEVCSRLHLDDHAPRRALGGGGGPRRHRAPRSSAETGLRLR